MTFMEMFGLEDKDLPPWLREIKNDLEFASTRIGNAIMDEVNSMLEMFFRDVKLKCEAISKTNYDQHAITLLVFILSMRPVHLIHFCKFTNIVATRGANRRQAEYYNERVAKKYT